MKKYPVVTIKKSQYDYIKSILHESCRAETERKAFIMLFGKEVKDTKNGYMSTEYSTMKYIVRAIAGNYEKRLNIVEG